MVLDLLFMVVGLAVFFALDQHHQWARQRMRAALPDKRWQVAVLAGCTALLPLLGIGVIAYFVASLLSPEGGFTLQDRQIFTMLMGYCLGLILLQSKAD